MFSYETDIKGEGIENVEVRDSHDHWIQHAC